MSTPALTIHWAGSQSFLNKERTCPEKGSWVNHSTGIAELLAWTGQGYAFTCPLTLNTTNSPAFAGEPDPSLGEFMRKTDGRSERISENVLATNVLCFDLDGDTTLEEFLETEFAQTRAMAVATSARHLRVTVDGQEQHRLRVFVVTPEPVEIFIGDDNYKDPLWLWKEVRAELLDELCTDLGIPTIADTSGNDLCRIWYGNTGPSNPIGNGDDRPAGELKVTTLDNILPANFVQDIKESTSILHLKTEEDVDLSDLPVGTPRQLKEASFILSNNVLSDWRATDYHEWVRLLHAIKKLDPDGAVLIEPFLQFSQQSSQHDACIEDILDRMEMLPPADEIHIGITALRLAADEDCEGWQSNCSTVSGNRTTAVAAGFVGTDTDLGTLVHLTKMYRAAGKTPPDFQAVLAPAPQQKPQPKKQARPRRQRSSFTATLQKQKRNRPRPKQVDQSLPLLATRDEFNGYDEPAVISSQPGSDF